MKQRPGVAQQRIDFKQFTQHSAVVSSQNSEDMKSNGQPLCEKKSGAVTMLGTT